MSVCRCTLTAIGIGLSHFAEDVALIFGLMWIMCIEQSVFAGFVGLFVFVLLIFYLTGLQVFTPTQFILDTRDPCWLKW